MRTAARRASLAATALVSPRAVLPVRRWVSSPAEEVDENGAGPSQRKPQDTKQSRWDSLGDPRSLDAQSLWRGKIVRMGEREQKDMSKPAEPPRMFSGNRARSNKYTNPLHIRVAEMPRSTYAGDALDMLEAEGGPIPLRLLGVVLCMDMDVAALARALPHVLDHGGAVSSSATSKTKRPPITDTRARLDAIGQVLYLCSRLKAYIFLPPAIDAALKLLEMVDQNDLTRLKKLKTDGEPVVSKAAALMLGRYHTLLTSMVTPQWNQLIKPTATWSRNVFCLGQDLTPPLRDGILRITLHMLSQIESLGPDASLGMRESTMNAFLGPFLTLDTADPIMRHLKEHGIHIAERELRHLAVLYFKSRYLRKSDYHMDSDSHLAIGRQYLSEAAKVHAEKASKVEHLTPADMRAQTHLSDVYRFLVASASPSFRGVLETLRPTIARLQKAGDRFRQAEEEEEADSMAEAEEGSSTEWPSEELTSESSSQALAFEAREAYITELVRVWSILLSRASRDKTVSDTDVIQLVASVPEDAVGGVTFTAAMSALLRRDQPKRAEQVWHAVLDRFGPAPSLIRAALMDAPLLTVAADVAARLNPDPVTAAVTRVDHYGLRAFTKFDMDMRTGKRHQMVRLDTHVLNNLLRICEQHSSPSVAFRLFHVAESRWGVTPDSESIRRVLNMARHHTVNEQDTFEMRVQMMKDTFLFRRWTPDDKMSHHGAYFVDGAEVTETRALLNPPGYTWRAEYGAHTPVDVARALFETIIFSNWPALRDIQSPLKHGGALSELRALISPEHVAGAPPTPMPYTVLPKGARSYAHLVPDAAAWDAYIKIIAYHFPDADIPLRLAYMRALGVVPKWRTMLIALKMVGEREGPRMRITTSKRTGLMRDELAVRAYLEDWLGEGEDGSPRVPTEQDVAEFWKEYGIKHAEKVHQRIMDERSGDR